MRKVANIFKSILKFGSPTTRKSPNKHNPVIISRENHTISRKNISEAALKVLYRLHKSGYAGYLVGGGVRDLLLGLTPKDFDVVTDAHPEEIQKIFRNSYIIGRRFRLVHVRFGREIIEVATFRGHEDTAARIKTQHGLLLRDNAYGTLEDDVWRRDFTVNALYYNIADFSVVDFTNGMEDLKHRTLRVIGDPVSRYREDPARMLRAIRLAGKLNFEIEPDSAKPIKKYRELLRQVPPARLFDKMLKIFHSGKSYEIYQLLKSYDLLDVLFPQVGSALEEGGFESFVIQALQNSDARVHDEKGINSAFLFAVLLWAPLKKMNQKHLENENNNVYQALHLAMQDVTQAQLQVISIPRKFTTVVREIWSLQYHLEHAKSRRVYRIHQHPRFRAACDFFLLARIVVL